MTAADLDDTARLVLMDGADSFAAFVKALRAAGVTSDVTTLQPLYAREARDHRGRSLHSRAPRTRLRPHSHPTRQGATMTTNMTTDTLNDLADRLTRAIDAVQDLADAAAAPVRLAHLSGKIGGLKVALSYVQETQRTNPACPSRSSSHPDDAQPCLLPDGHDGWHKGLGAVWSRGIPS